MDEYKKVRLGDVAEIINGYAFDSKLFNENKQGIPLIRIRDVLRGYSETYTTENADSRFIINQGDLLIGMDGEFNCSPWQSLPSYLNQRVCKVEVNKSKTESQYIYYSLHSKLKEIENKTSFVTVKHISSKQIEGIEIPLPPIETQKQIAATLDKVTKIIAENKKLLEKYDLLIKSRFIEMFGDPVINPMGWEIRSLDSLGKWESGGTPPRKNPEYFKGNIPWYSAGELNSLYLEDSIEKITEEAIKNSSAKLFKEGSLFVGMYDTAAFKMGIAKQECSSNQACANIWPNTKTNILWLYYELSEMKEYFLQNRRGVRQKNLNLGMIKGFEIPVPPIELQQQFADFVQQIDKSKFEKSLCE